MLLKSNFINKLNIGINNVLWFLVAESPNQYGNDTFGDNGVTIRSKNQFVFIQFGMYPNLALTTFDKVIIRLVLFLYQWKSLSEFNHIFVTLHPVVEHGELVYYLFLYLFYGHAVVLFKNTTRWAAIQVFKIKITVGLQQHISGPFYAFHQLVHFFLGIVEAKTGPNRSWDLIKIHNRLCTMVARTDGNAQFIHNGTNVVGMNTFYIKGYHRSFICCGSVDFQSIDRKQLFGGIFHQLLFILGYSVKTNAVHVIQSCTKGYASTDVRRTSFKLMGQIGISGLFKSDFGNHFAASLVGG